MSKPPNDTPSALTVALDIAQRVRAHARLCRQVAVDSWDEHVAGEFAQLASEFLEVAAQIEDECLLEIPRGRLH